MHEPLSGALYSADDRTPLLGRLVSTSAPPRKRLSPSTICLLLTLLIVFICTGDEIIQPAQTRVFESIYCREYYAKHDPSLIGSDGRDGVAEEYCKMAEIQGQVALLKGWQGTFDQVGNLVLGIPWGYFADSYGRKPLQVMIAAGFFLRAAWIQVVCFWWQTFDLKISWMSGVLSIFGGGTPVYVAMIYTIVSDVVSEGERIGVFLQIQAAMLSAMFFAPPLSALLMKRNPWIPMLIGLVILFFAVFVTASIPETLNYREPAEEPEVSFPAEPQSPRKIPQTLLGRVRAFLLDAAAATRFITSDFRIMTVTPAFMVHHLLGGSANLLQQVISVRYHWTLSNATLLLALRSGFTVLVLLGLLPLLSRYISSRNIWSMRRRDAVLSAFSAAVLTMGLAGLTFANTIPLLVLMLILTALGYGLMALLRSILVSLVEPHHAARLNTVIALIDTIGMMLGMPFLAWLFEVGLSEGGNLVALPFLVFSIATALICIVCGWLVAVEEKNEQKLAAATGDSHSTER